MRNILDFVNERLKTDKTPCFGTRANLCYHLGSLYRRLERHDEAESTYAEAVALYYEHIKSRSPEDHDDELFTTRRVAMCIGLGFGWQNLTRGYLRRAENALAAARSMLAKSLDPVVPSYIELLYGSIRRCRAGKDIEELGEAIKSLEQARAAFEEHDHPRYEARACWELALACNQIGELDKADEHLKVIEKHALAQNNLKWQANVHIQRSRIYRNRGEYLRSLEAAEKLLEIAEQCKQILPKVDAQITRGEAFFHLAADTGQKEADYDLAVEDFQTALQMLQKQKSPELNISQTLNPKIASVCVLRMAQCFARIGEEAKANSHFAEWLMVSSTIEHGWVHDLAEEVRIEIGKMSEPFYISAKDPTKWDYSKQVRALRKWLYAQAMKHTKNNWAEAARLIGVERATLYQWRYSSNQRVRRARTTSKKDRGSSE